MTPYNNNFIRSVATLKNYVIKWRTGGEVKKANILAKAILAYEKSRITIDELWHIFRQLEF